MPVHSDVLRDVEPREDFRSYAGVAIARVRLQMGLQIGLDDGRDLLVFKCRTGLYRLGGFRCCTNERS